MLVTRAQLPACALESANKVFVTHVNAGPQAAAGRRDGAVVALDGMPGDGAPEQGAKQGRVRNAGKGTRSWGITGNHACTRVHAASHCNR